jgi:hypothetical protein
MLIQKNYRSMILSLPKLLWIKKLWNCKMSFWKKKKKFKKSSTKLKSLKKNSFSLLKTISSLMRRRKIWRQAIQIKMLK